MSQQDEERGWEYYFSGLPSGTIREIEVEAHTKKLTLEDGRLFSGQGDIEVWQKDEGNVGIQSSSLENPSLTVQLARVSTWNPVGRAPDGRLHQLC